jgi:hypothetical protein
MRKNSGINAFTFIPPKEYDIEKKINKLAHIIITNVAITTTNLNAFFFSDLEYSDEYQMINRIEHIVATVENNKTTNRKKKKT